MPRRQLQQVLAEVGVWRRGMSNIQKYRDDFEALVRRGEEVLQEMRNRLNSNQSSPALLNPNVDYQCWYTEAYALVNQLLPGRLTEFEQIYEGDGARRHSTIQEWLNGHLYQFARTNSATPVFLNIVRQFENQLNILKSLGGRFESALFDIQLLVQADLFNSELDSARELAMVGFLRAAGAVAGVVLEKHLRQVVENHNINIRKKNPTIGDYNDRLKSEGILDVPVWRQIQWLADIRNLCDHDKKKEPTREDVEDLIKGVAKVTKTLF